MNNPHVWQDALHRDDWALPSGLCSANGSDVAQRFGIYRNNVLSACTQALADTFPVCQTLVGEAFSLAWRWLLRSSNCPARGGWRFTAKALPNLCASFHPRSRCRIWPT